MSLQVRRALGKGIWDLTCTWDGEAILLLSHRDATVRVLVNHMRIDIGLLLIKRIRSYTKFEIITTWMKWPIQYYRRNKRKLYVVTIISTTYKKYRACYICRNREFMRGSMDVFILDEKLPQLSRSHCDFPGLWAL